MNAVFQILVIASPLMLASFGALCSEYAGRMAIFAEGIVNMGAFLCFAFSALLAPVLLPVLAPVFGPVAANGIVVVFAIFLSLLCSFVFITAFCVLIEKCSVNPFLISLALNLVCSGLISLFSVVFFKTRGVLVADGFALDGFRANLFTTIFAFAVCLAVGAFLQRSRKGLYLRITGSDEAVLLAGGINTKRIRIASWGIASVLCALAGCVMTLRLSSFVPGVSSGTGWLALAAVFLGRKKVVGTFVSVLVFSIARFFAANIQNFSSFSQIPSGILLALPYLLALVFIFASDGKQK